MMQRKVGDARRMPVITRLDWIPCLNAPAADCWEGGVTIISRRNAPLCFVCADSPIYGICAQVICHVHEWDHHTLVVRREQLRGALNCSIMGSTLLQTLQPFRRLSSILEHRQILTRCGGDSRLKNHMPRNLQRRHWCECFIPQWRPQRDYTRRRGGEWCASQYILG